MNRNTSSPDRRGTGEALLLRVSEAASLMGMSRSHLYQAIDRGEIPVIRLGRSARIPRAWLETWIGGQVATWENARQGAMNRYLGPPAR